MTTGESGAFAILQEVRAPGQECQFWPAAIPGVTRPLPQHEMGGRFRACSRSAEGEQRADERSDGERLAHLVPWEVICQLKSCAPGAAFG
ncbi:hypothetical protein [Massilia sp. TWR1-2-2]|uniref:hypothetical protein n=1 Tax=Massilia sp. TWR1-2-2 TaxID=2804584 RepID=UPI003CF7823B